MQKIKRFKAAIAAIVIFSMIAIYGSVPRVEAASLKSVKDTISSSVPGASGVSHTIVFMMGSALLENDYIEFDFQTGINLTAASAVCPDSTAGVVSGQVITCTIGAGGLNADIFATTTVSDTVNPADTDDYSVFVTTYRNGGEELETAEAKIYIIDQVTVSARVPSTLAFSISTTTPDQTINAEPFTGTSSPTSIAFGTLDHGQEYLMGHTLKVSTNADDGFVVTVHQDGNLRTAAGADIDGYSTSSAAAWLPPTADINDENTWGHIGVTSDDTDAFTADTYQGLYENNPMTVLRHDGPAAGSGTGAGETLVAYKLEISALQEAGDYQNLLTYICTPTY